MDYCEAAIVDIIEANVIAKQNRLTITKFYQLKVTI